MKHLLFSLVALLSLNLAAQVPGSNSILEPVQWSASLDKKSDTQYLFKYRADVLEKWHLYSQKNGWEGGIPLSITYELNGKGIEADSLARESASVTEYDQVFEADQTFFDDFAEFEHDITVTDPDVRYVNAELFGQACDDKACVLVDGFFYFDLEELEVYEGTYEEPTQEEATTPVVTNNKTETGEPIYNPEPKPVEAVADENKSWLTIFLLAFAGGFAALLTPCVFPMIPMTVSFFTKQSKTKAAGVRNAIIYGISIIVIYVLLGSLVVGIFGADSLNALSTNVTFNIIFFVLLVVFALSFLGAFEIVLPNSWANKVDRQADRGGVIGILFMALALAIVSFSCTGPIVGTLLVEASSQGGIGPIVGMLGFSTALALPFMLFAMFPGWLNSLPKSGGWLNTVKVFLGFLELALAFKFLSNADLVLQAHWLEREVFLAIWIAVFATLSLYMLGKIRLPHDGPAGGHISVGRLMIALLTLMFTVYLVPGMWGAPLKIISGFPPPMSYSEAPYGVGFTKLAVTNGQRALPVGAHLGPHDLVTFHDYNEGMAYAREVDKPALIDLTGWACVNCRKMEERVWGVPQILEMLEDEYVLISLYVDEKKALPKADQYKSPTTGKKIRTVGNQWSDFSIKYYAVNAQPYYVLLDQEGNSLVPPRGYTPEVEVYKQWLRDGVEAYEGGR